MKQKLIYSKNMVSQREMEGWWRGVEEWRQGGGGVFFSLSDSQDGGINVIE